MSKVLSMALFAAVVVSTSAFADGKVDCVNDPNKACANVTSPATASFSAKKSEGDCPFRAALARAKEKQQVVSVVHGDQSAGPVQ